MSTTERVRVLGVGDNVVDRYHDLGMMFPGGNPLNVAVAARRAGADAGYIGVVGTDEAAGVVRAALVAEGVATDRLRVVGGPNAYADVTVIDGDRVFVRSDKGVSRFALDDQDIAYAAEFDIVHSGEFGGLEWQVPVLAVSSLVAFDFGHQRSSEYLDPLLAHLEVAFFSASGLDDDETYRLLKRAVQGGARLALATRGSAPTLCWDGKSTWQQPVHGVEHVVDTLGAGDAFIGTFLVANARREDIAIALEAGATAAAATCMHFGAFGNGRAFVAGGVSAAS
jgi:sugar/nucleoside kinase (ribokinase family)